MPSSNKNKDNNGFIRDVAKWDRVNMGVILGGRRRGGSDDGLGSNEDGHDDTWMSGCGVLIINIIINTINVHCCCDVTSQLFSLKMGGASDLKKPRPILLEVGV